MSGLMAFCDRLDGRPGEHSCELWPRHAEACRCECDECAALVEGPARGSEVTTGRG